MQKQPVIKSRFLSKAIVLAVVMILLSITLSGQIPDYKSQSLFIYNFSKYISWPDSTNSNDFVIGIYGNSPITEELKIMASLKKSADGGDIIVKQIDNLQRLDSLHILYIASSKSREITTINSYIADKSILTVAEREGMALKGAMISFIVMENDILKFEVNKTLLNRENLKIAPQLLNLGYIID